MYGGWGSNPSQQKKIQQKKIQFDLILLVETQKGINC